MSAKTVLISGAGIAGPTLAYWLAHYGFQPTIVERAPELRTGGYIIDFWGIGYDVAFRMGLTAELRQRSYSMQEVRLVGADGCRVTGFDVRVFERNLGDRYFSILRGDLASSIYRAIEDRVETIFGDHIVGMEQDQSEVQVTFAHGQPRSFDLVVGADGLHSTVRELGFGEEAQFEKYLGYYTAACSTAGYRPRDGLAYISYSTPGRQLARVALREDRTVFFFIFARDEKLECDHQDRAEQLRVLHEVFQGAGWECDDIIVIADHCQDLYFDAVSQIRMPTWSQGRLTLVGDACFCPSLLAGQGSALAMAGAYILAGELAAADGDYRRAFKSYEGLFKPFVEKKQVGAENFGGWFAPRTRLGILARNLTTGLLNVPIISGKMVNNMIADRIELPDYSKISSGQEQR